MDDVLLNITGSRGTGDGREEINLTTEGLMAVEGEKVTLSYTDGGAGSIGGSMICVDGDIITLGDPWDMETQLVFEQGKSYATSCRTPFGDMELNLFATLVDLGLGRDKGKIELEYILEYAGTHVLNRLTVNYTKDGRKGATYEN